MNMKTYLTGGLVSLAMAVSATVAVAQELTVYSGRGESFVGPVLALFEKETGIKLKVRYGSTAEIAALLQEEGAKSPADVFWAQDGGALGANEKMFETLPEKFFKGQPAHFKGESGKWVGITGRSRSIVFSPARAPKASLPDSILGLTDPKWKGRIGWAPANASFQSFVAAMRVTEGDEATKKWVAGMAANGAKSYKNNVAIVQAIADGEIDAGLVNTYYLSRFKTRDEKFPVEQTFFKNGDIGNLLNVAGVGVLSTSKHKQEALKLVEFLLSPAAQQYFASVGAEYPVIGNVIPSGSLKDVADPVKASPTIAIDKLSDVEGTRAILSAAGLI